MVAEYVYNKAAEAHRQTKSRSKELAVICVPLSYDLKLSACGTHASLTYFCFVRVISDIIFLVLSISLYG